MSRVLQRLKKMPGLYDGGVVVVTTYNPQTDVRRTLTVHMIGSKDGDVMYGYAVQNKWRHRLYDTAWFTGVQFLTAERQQFNIPMHYIEDIRVAVYDRGERITYTQEEIDDYIIREMSSTSGRLPPTFITHV